MFSVLLSILGAADAGDATFDDPLYDVCPEAPATQDVSGALLQLDGGVAVLDPGTLLFPPERAKRTACLMETCDVDRQGKKALLDGPSQPAWWVGWASALGLGLGFGFAAHALWNIISGALK